jgi:two-component system, NtrC family, sensor histidine kinase HydH
MPLQLRKRLDWMDLLWLVFLGCLAILPPVREFHKQLILLAIGILQLFEGQIIASLPERGRGYVVFLKILLAAVLLSHTGELEINSSYYPIFYLPVVTAAVYYGPLGTLIWSLIASAAYCSYLIPALQEYQLTGSAIAELAIRILFFFLAAMVVNRFATENRTQMQRYQTLAEQLAKTNRRLEQVQAEARRSERLAALGQLSAGLAHEIRNPLGIIKGSAEMLTQRLRTAEPLAAELAGYISSEVNRLSALVTRFLDFARPLQLDLTLQSLPDVVDRALQAVAANWSGPIIKVERHYAPGLPAIPLDDAFSEQVFVNLAQNAYEAMTDKSATQKGNAQPPAGENPAGTLRVSIRLAERGSRRGLEVRMQDTGPGVSPQMREQIFNPFVTTKKTGIGLGLSLVSRIVDEHRGSLELLSGSGGSGGACFVVFLPLSEKEAPALQTAATL